MINSKVQSVISWTRRYVSLPLVVAVVYAAFVLFFNENSYSHSAELQNQIDELRAQIKENNDTMQYYLRLNHNLDTDAGAHSARALPYAAAQRRCVSC